MDTGIIGGHILARLVGKFGEDNVILRTNRTGEYFVASRNEAVQKCASEMIAREKFKEACLRFL